MTYSKKQKNNKNAKQTHLRNMNNMNFPELEDPMFRRNYLISTLELNVSVFL